jgi:hypothetical protein
MGELTIATHKLAAVSLEALHRFAIVSPSEAARLQY